MDVTTRDKIWAVTFAYISCRQSFRLADLPIDDSERITAQLVWSVMEHMGFLERHGDDRRTWYRSLTSGAIIDFSGTHGSVGWDDDEEWLILQD